MKHAVLVTLAILAAALISHADESSTLAKPSSKPRVIISTDLGGSDADDTQSLIHYLLYADSFDTEGIISSPPGPGRSSSIHKVLDHYASDWQWLRAHSDFPHARSLRKRVKQGSVEPAAEKGFGAPTEGSEWIIRCAREDDPRPLWVLVWGCITDVAQALHDAPDIRAKLRVHFIGSWNLRQDKHAFAYIEKEHPELFTIHNDTTFRGWYRGGNQAADLSNQSFVAEHVAEYGALGQLFASCHASGVPKASIKMGDTPTVAYLLRGDPDAPTLPHWGGRFVKLAGRPNWYVDDPSPEFAEAPHPGARTVNRWRTDYLRDWQQRMTWCLPIPKTRWTSFLEHDDNWFRSQEAEQIAANVISHQAISGGWAKSLGTFQFPFFGNVSEIDASFDNQATDGEIRFLAKMAQITGDATYANNCLQGIDFILATQHQRSGGWPQEISSEEPYADQITYNDDAMVNILELLSDISSSVEPFKTIVDEPRRAACEKALQRGIQCVLQTQVITNGTLTLWCAQHDRNTLLPCAARAYEHPSLSGQESARILRFLMKVPGPTPDIIASVHAGCRWFHDNQISGIRRKQAPNGDISMKPAPDARPLWARFNELGTNRPIFSDHDGIIRYKFEEISQQRRNKYRWYSSRAEDVLTVYQMWSKQYPNVPNRLMTFAGVERRLYPARQSDEINREVAVRNYASVANVSQAARIDYPPVGADEQNVPPPSRVILCPGGNYQYLKLRNAHQQAAEIARMGIPVTILKYRTPVSLEGTHNAEAHPLEDLFELMRQLRQESGPAVKIGIIGSDAGGHLALMAATHSDKFGTGPDFVGAANAPFQAPPVEWMTAMLGPENGTDPLLQDFYSAGLHSHAGACPISLSYREGSDFRPDATQWAQLSLQRKLKISIADDTDPRELPKAFSDAVSAAGSL